MKDDKCCTPGLHLCQWGRAGWTMLHVWAHTAPEQLSEENQRDMRNLLSLFAKHIPCLECRDHFEHYLQQHMTDEALRSRLGLINLLHSAHNSVNKRTYKPEMSIEEHMAMFRPPDLKTVTPQNTRTTPHLQSSYSLQSPCISFDVQSLSEPVGCRSLS